ncbi:tetratricopeptide repeat protein [bacterium]|nr:tetratricopeptide repeat protein [bacterium]
MIKKLLLICMCVALIIFDISGVFSQQFEIDDELLNLKNGNPLIKNIKARKLFITDKLDEAIVLLKENLRENPQNTDSQFLLAAVYAKQKKYLQAKDLFYSLLKTNPKRKTYRKLFKIILKRWGNKKYLIKYADLLAEQDEMESTNVRKQFNDGSDVEYEYEESEEMTEENEEYTPPGGMMNFGSKSENLSTTDDDGDGE